MLGGALLALAGCSLVYDFGGYVDGSAAIASSSTGAGGATSSSSKASASTGGTTSTATGGGGYAGGIGDVVWATAIGGAQDDSVIGNSISVDPAGSSLYAAGSYRGSVVIGTTALSVLKATDYAHFFTRLDASGAPSWALTSDESSDTHFATVTRDAAGDGVFGGSCVAAIGVPCTSPLDAFVMKVDATGSPIWSQVIGDVAGIQHGRTVAVAKDESITFNGIFGGAINTGACKLVAQDASDVFILRLTKDGACVWGQQIFGAGAQYSTGLALDDTGAVLVVGSFATSLSISGLPSLMSASVTDNTLFVAKFDASGTPAWVEAIGPVGMAEGGFVTTRGTDVYVSAAISGSLMIDPNAPTFGGLDAAIVKLDGAGALLWSKVFGGPADDLPTRVIPASDGTLYFGGQYASTATFGVFQLQPAMGHDGFLCRLDPSGVPLQARSYAGTGDVGIFDVDLDASFDLFVSGTFSGKLDLGTTALASNGSTDVFFAKISP